MLDRPCRINNVKNSTTVSKIIDIINMREHIITRFSLNPFIRVLLGINKLMDKKNKEIADKRKEIINALIPIYSE